MKNAMLLAVGIGIVLGSESQSLHAEGTIAACVKLGNGQTRIVGYDTACLPSETKTFWNVEGPQGPQGPPGPAGGGLKVVDANAAEIGSLSWPLVLMRHADRFFFVNVGPAGFWQMTGERFYLEAGCAGQAYQRLPPENLFVHYLYVFGSLGYYVPRDAVGLQPPEVFWSKPSADAPCEESGDIVEPGELFYPYSTIDLSGFVVPFRLE